MLAYITWDVSPEIFKIGNFAIGWYGLLFALGFLIGQRIMVHIFKAEGVNPEKVDTLTLYMVLATVIGARVGHYLFYETPQLVADPVQWFIDMVLPPYRGLASHGATIGIITGLYLFARREKMNFFWIADRVVIGVALGGCFIRLGNLMNSEIVGTPTDVPWAFLFVNNLEYLPTVPRHPAQLYEALSCLVLFFLLLGIWSRYKTRLPQGTITGIFLVWVFGLRFVWEFFKENQVSFEDGMALNMGQWLSIPAVLFGLAGIWWAIRRHETRIWREDLPESINS
jgi:phosphatidylglycerol:prolipoprotein diacylglycerol transferase